MHLQPAPADDRRKATEPTPAILRACRASGSDLPAQQVNPTVRRSARGIEEPRAIEVIGHRPMVVARSPDRFVMFA